MKLENLILSAIVLFFGTPLQLIATAREFTEGEQAVEAQLQAVIKTQTEEGYKLAFPRTLGRLAQGVQAPKTVLLNPSREYSFVAVCDEICNDVDIIVKDMNGREVASDVANYAIAVVPFNPPAEGRYEISVKMKRCSARTCNFGLGVFIKSNR
ncbi:MAG TPA: hypothetical protein DC064_16655 [Cyanobacteria bacterium UBA9273]|nr:hypothetical protein [Cyanobacteria bacterium UBA9273]